MLTEVAKLTIIAVSVCRTKYRICLTFSQMLTLITTISCLTTFTHLKDTWYELSDMLGCVKNQQFLNHWQKLGPVGPIFSFIPFFLNLLLVLYYFYPSICLLLAIEYFYHYTMCTLCQTTEYFSQHISYITWGTNWRHFINVHLLQTFYCVCVTPTSQGSKWQSEQKCYTCSSLVSLSWSPN